MLKSDLFLKLLMILMVSSIFSLLVLRLYPKTQPHLANAKIDSSKVEPMTSPTPQPEKGYPTNVSISSVSIGMGAPTFSLPKIIEKKKRDF